MPRYLWSMPQCTNLCEAKATCATVLPSSAEVLSTNATVLSSSEKVLNTRGKVSSKSTAAKSSGQNSITAAEVTATSYNNESPAPMTLPYIYTAWHDLFHSQVALSLLF